MPRLDGTGPEGKGPKTGRGIGNCNITQENIEKELPKKRFFGYGRARRDGQGRIYG